MVPSQSNKYALNDPCGNFSFLRRGNSLFVIIRHSTVSINPPNARKGWRRGSESNRRRTRDFDFPIHLVTVVHTIDEALAALGVQSPHFEPLDWSSVGENW